jgi:hypothetical protein
MGLKTLDAAWKLYLETVIPRDASATQIIETKRGFYAGASAVFAVMFEFDESLSDEEGEKILKGLAKEIEQFAEAQLNG